MFVTIVQTILPELLQGVWSRKDKIYENPFGVFTACNIGWSIHFIKFEGAWYKNDSDKL